MDEKNRLLNPPTELAMIETLAYSGDEETDEYAQVLSECRLLITEICQEKGYNSEECLKEFNEKVEYAKSVDALTIEEPYTKEQVAEVMDIVHLISCKKESAKDVVPLFDIVYRLVEELDIQFMRL